MSRRRPYLWCPFALGLFLQIFLAWPLAALPGGAQIASICDSAAEVAARETGVPLDVLRAISLTETGRRTGEHFLPWPWTVNMEGVGKWFDDLDAAQDYVDRHFSRGARSFDVGCFQINYRWHHKAFSSVEEMFDPISNARYAARFLSELHSEFGDWSKAAGAYHSRTPKYAQKYASRFRRIRASLPDAQPVRPAMAEPELRPVADQASSVRLNRYPLLRSGRTLNAASLVPLAGNPPVRLIDIGNRRPLLESR